MILGRLCGPLLLMVELAPELLSSVFKIRDLLAVDPKYTETPARYW